MLNVWAPKVQEILSKPLSPNTQGLLRNHTTKIYCFVNVKRYQEKQNGLIVQRQMHKIYPFENKKKTITSSLNFYFEFSLYIIGTSLQMCKQINSGKN